MSAFQRTPSVSSVASSGPSDEPKVPVAPIRRIPFVRRRLPRDQTLALVAVFEVKTHPSKEDRATLAKELGIELKTVSAWFQNKRRSVRKKALAWNRASHPESDLEKTYYNYYRTTYGPLSRRSVLSLDCIATARERPSPRLRVPSTQNESNQQSPTNTEDLWEHIPSSPPMPPSSPAADSVRLSALPVRPKTRRSLEWACMNARIGRRTREVIQEKDEDMDVPPLMIDTASGEAEDDETEADEAVTPDMSAHSLNTSVEIPSPTALGITRTRKTSSPKDDMEAAIALLGFMGSQERTSE